ncbi:MAG: hypothetical protein JSR99_13425 [Proteobacteria bacterium]|nr:hypothetical protein [Pseudomonadota bacterium]
MPLHRASDEALMQRSSNPHTGKRSEIEDTIIQTGANRGMGVSRPKSLEYLFWSIVGWMAICAQNAHAADEPKDLLSTTRAAIKDTNLTPYDVGSRYGQALGAAETCAGGKITAKTSILASLYTGANLEEFKAQEKKIYDAWMSAKHCVRDDYPDQCKVIIDESCAAAVSEIGPKGTVLPGLFEISNP